MRENRKSRVRISLNCEMIREEFFNENVEFLDAHFQSEIIQNLEATDGSNAGEGRKRHDHHD